MTEERERIGQLQNRSATDLVNPVIKIKSFLTQKYLCKFEAMFRAKILEFFVVGDATRWCCGRDGGEGNGDWGWFP